MGTETGTDPRDPSPPNATADPWHMGPAVWGSVVNARLLQLGTGALPEWAWIADEGGAWWLIDADGGEWTSTEKHAHALPAHMAEALVQYVWSAPTGTIDDVHAVGRLTEARFSLWLEYGPPPPHICIAAALVALERITLDDARVLLAGEVAS